MRNIFYNCTTALQQGAVAHLPIPCRNTIMLCASSRKVTCEQEMSTPQREFRHRRGAKIRSYEEGQYRICGNLLLARADVDRSGVQSDGYGMPSSVLLPQLKFALAVLVDLKKPKAFAAPLGLDDAQAWSAVQREEWRCSFSCRQGRACRRPVCSARTFKVSHAAGRFRASIPGA